MSEVSKEELDQRLKNIDLKIDHIDESVNGMSDKIETVLDKLEKQNGSIIKLQQETIHNSKEIQEVKTDLEKSKDKIWNELREKDKKTRWFITTAMSAAVIILSVIFFLITYLSTVGK